MLAAPAGQVEETANPAFLQLDDVVAGYSGHEVLHGVSLSVSKPGVTALLGPNGAGKTTLLRAATGIIPVTSGRVVLDGQDITHRRTHARSRLGLCDIPEGRGIFPSLTVRENLRLQGRGGPDSDNIATALETFPELSRLLSRVAGSMSGGEQQMLALSRAYLSKPKVVLLDEVSLGLAPVIVDRIYEVMRDMASRGTALLLVEQYVTRALELADRVVVLDRGRIVLSGSTEQLADTDMFSRYLGIEIEAE